MDETEHAPGLPSLPQCLLTLIENEEWIWNYCAESGTQPHFFVHVGRMTYAPYAPCWPLIAPDGLEWPLMASAGPPDCVPHQVHHVALIVIDGH